MAHSKKELSWTVHLARNQPHKVPIILLIAVVAGLFGLVMMGSVLAFVLGVLVIVFSASDFIFPEYFEINEKGARRKCLWSVSEISWDKVRRVIVGSDGVKLSPLAKRSRLAPFRGVFLRSDKNLQEIVSCVEYWKEQHAEGLGTTTHGGDEGGIDRTGCDSDRETPTERPGHHVP